MTLQELRSKTPTELNLMGAKLLYPEYEVVTCEEDDESEMTSKIVTDPVCDGVSIDHYSESPYSWWTKIFAPASILNDAWAVATRTGWGAALKPTAAECWSYRDTRIGRIDRLDLGLQDLTNPKDAATALLLAAILAAEATE